MSDAVYVGAAIVARRRGRSVLHPPPPGERGAGARAHARARSRRIAPDRRERWGPGRAPAAPRCVTSGTQAASSRATTWRWGGLPSAGHRPSAHVEPRRPGDDQVGFDRHRRCLVGAVCLAPSALANWRDPSVRLWRGGPELTVAAPAGLYRQRTSPVTLARSPRPAPGRAEERATVHRYVHGDRRPRPRLREDRELEAQARRARRRTRRRSPPGGSSGTGSTGSTLRSARSRCSR